MHMLFTEKEKEWMYLNKWRCPIKQGCPANIRKSIEEKKKIIDSQMDGKHEDASRKP